MKYLQDPQNLQNIASGEDFGSMFNSWIEITKEKFDFEKAKQSKLAEIKIKRDKALNSNIIFDNQEYKGTENARTLFCTRFNLSIFPIEWRLADDITWIILDKEKSTGLANAFFNNSSVVYQKESVFLTTLNNAITIDDVNNIIVNY